MVSTFGQLVNSQDMPLFELFKEIDPKIDRYIMQHSVKSPQHLDSGTYEAMQALSGDRYEWAKPMVAIVRIGDTCKVRSKSSRLHVRRILPYQEEV